MEESIETLRPYLVKGIPDLDIPSIDPIDIGNLIVSEKTRSNGLHISAKNIKAFGPSSFRLKKLEWVSSELISAREFLPISQKWRELRNYFHFSVLDYGKLYNVEVFFPRLHVEGTYDVSGNILLVPIRGSGPFLGNFSQYLIFSLKTNENNFIRIFFLVYFIFYAAGCTGNVRLQFTRQPENDLVQIKKLAIRIKVADGSLRLHNLFNGDKLLGSRVLMEIFPLFNHN